MKILVTGGAGFIGSAVCRYLIAEDWRTFKGTYHLAGTGSTSWHGFADAAFDLSQAHGRKKPHVNAIATTDYPTPAARPANSQLDCAKLKSTFGAELPHWQNSLKHCIKRLCSDR